MAGKGRIENLRPPWKPGESGNLSGRPRRLPISDRYETLSEVRLSKEARDALRLPPEVKRRIKTYGDLLAWARLSQPPAWASPVERINDLFSELGR